MYTSYIMHVNNDNIGLWKGADACIIEIYLVNGFALKMFFLEENSVRNR